MLPFRPRVRSRSPHRPAGMSVSFRDRINTRDAGRCAPLQPEAHGAVTYSDSTRSLALCLGVLARRRGAARQNERPRCHDKQRHNEDTPL